MGPFDIQQRLGLVAGLAGIGGRKTVGDARGGVAGKERAVEQRDRAGQVVGVLDQRDAIRVLAGDSAAQHRRFVVKRVQVRRSEGGDTAEENLGLRFGGASDFSRILEQRGQLERRHHGRVAGTCDGLKMRPVRTRLEGGNAGA